MEAEQKAAALFQEIEERGQLVPGKSERELNEEVFRLEPGSHGLPDAQGRPRNWILEIHFIDRERQIGGFFEQLLTSAPVI